MRWLFRSLSSDFDYARSGKRSLLARFWGKTAIYGLTSLLTRLGSFLLLPIYWHRLPPGEFGLLAISEMVTMGVTGILTLCLEAALTRFYFEWPEEERPRRLAAIWLFSSGAAIALTLVAYAVSSVLWDRFVHQVPFHPYIELALAGALVRSFSVIPFCLLRLREELQKFTLMQFISLLMSAGVGLYLVFVRGLGAVGILLGSVAGYLITTLFWIAYMTRRIQVQRPAALVGPLLRYSLPLTPTVALAFGALLCDRYFLERFAPLALIGLYSIATRFAALVREASSTLKNAWIPFATRLSLERADGSSVVAKMANYYLAVLLAGGLGVALLSREFIEWLGPDQYGGAYRFIPVLVLACMMEPFDVLSGLGLSLKNHSRTILLTALLETAVTVLLVGFLTARWGPDGTVWAVVASRSSMVGLRMVISLRIHPVPYEFGRLAGMGLLAGAAFAAGSAIPAWSLAVRIAAKSLLLAAFVLVAAWLFLDLRRALEIVRGSTTPPAVSPSDQPPPESRVFEA